jgi:transcriptional regulator with XRE-family HTH domain
VYKKNEILHIFYTFLHFLTLFMYFTDMDTGIKAFRRRMGYQTQRELAEVLNAKQSNVSKWEAGNGYPSYEVIKRLFELGATPEELFGIKGNPPPQASNDELTQQLLERVALLEERMKFKQQGEDYRPEVQEGRTGT